jgi:hypothetical protein
MEPQDAFDAEPMFETSLSEFLFGDDEPRRRRALARRSGSHRAPAAGRTGPSRAFERRLGFLPIGARHHPV